MIKRLFIRVALIACLALVFLLQFQARPAPTWTLHRFENSSAQVASLVDEPPLGKQISWRGWPFAYCVAIDTFGERQQHWLWYRAVASLALLTAIAVLTCWVSFYWLDDDTEMDA